MNIFPVFRTSFEVVRWGSIYFFNFPDLVGELVSVSFFQILIRLSKIKIGGYETNQAFTIAHIVIGLSLHIHSFIHLRFNSNAANG